MFSFSLVYHYCNQNLIRSIFLLCTVHGYSPHGIYLEIKISLETAADVFGLFVVYSVVIGHIKLSSSKYSVKCTHFVTNIRVLLKMAHLCLYFSDPLSVSVGNPTPCTVLTHQTMHMGGGMVYRTQTCCRWCCYVLVCLCYHRVCW